MMAVEGNMPATVICFESFRREQVCQRADGLVPDVRNRAGPATPAVEAA